MLSTANPRETMRHNATHFELTTSQPILSTMPLFLHRTHGSGRSLANPTQCLEIQLRAPTLAGVNLDTSEATDSTYLKFHHNFDCTEFPSNITCIATEVQQL